jgi:hypothetical protein
MTRNLTLTLLATATLFALTGSLHAQTTDKDTALRARLIGTWRMASMKVNGQQRDLPQSAVTYKHVTPAGFTWLSHAKDTGIVFRAAGGTYTLRDGVYTEKIGYGMGQDFEAVKDGEHPFKCTVEGDRWHHDGKLASGTTIEEVWERVTPAGR